MEWQTRTTQNRVPKGMGVRLSPRPPRQNFSLLDSVLSNSYRTYNDSSLTGGIVMKFFKLFGSIPATKSWMFIFGFLTCFLLPTGLYFHRFHDQEVVYFYAELISFFFCPAFFLLFLHLRIKSSETDTVEHTAERIEHDLDLDHKNT